MPKNCQKCTEKPKHREMCEKCFCKYLEKKIDSNIKKNFKYKSQVNVLNTQKILYKILKKISEKNNHITIKPTKNTEKSHIIPKTLNNTTKEFIEQTHKTKNFSNKKQKITIFENYTKQEIETYAKNQKIQTTTKKTNNPYENFIEKLSNKNPEFLFGIKKFMEKIKK